MKDKIIVKEGIWYDSKMAKRKVRIAIADDQANDKRKRFSVWFDTEKEQFGIHGGYYSSEYGAIDMIEKITGQKVQWHNTA